MARVRVVQLALEPILLLIYPVPKPALIPLFMIWLGIGDFSKIAVIALGCLLPVVIATFNGAQQRRHDAALVGTGARNLRAATALARRAARRRAADRQRACAPRLRSRSSCSSARSSSRPKRASAILIFSYGGVGADDAMLAVVLYLAALGYLLDRLYLAGLRTRHVLACVRPLSTSPRTTAAGAIRPGGS